ncbi:E3 ubiquitin-protein ligase ubr1, variant 2 [Basidiobolus ranarum]
MLLDWLKELCSTQPGEVSTILMQIVGDQLRETWKNESVDIREVLEALHFIPQDIVKFDLLLLYDACLWKEAKATLKEFYFLIFGSTSHMRQFIASRFALIYPQLCENILVYNQEFEESIMLFSVEIFTVPLLSATLVREYNFITTMLLILRSYFLHDEIFLKEIAECDNVMVNCESLAMTNRRCFHIFDDLRYLMYSENVKSIVPLQPQLLTQYIRFISIFQGMNPTKRCVDDHAEYEAEATENAMNATIYVAELNRSFSGCYKSDGKVLGDAILQTIDRISFWMNASRPEGSVYPVPKFKLERGVAIIDYQTYTQFISLHHPLHWYLSQLLENVECLEEETLKKYHWKSLFDLLTSSVSIEEASGADIKHLLMLFDHPIRVCALLAQSNAGVWNKNGPTTKEQVEQFLDPSLRENTYDLDLLLVQTAFSVLPPDQVMLTILDRYALLDWTNGNDYLDLKLYDESQFSIMIEELLHLLILCVGDRSTITKMPIRDRVMREIIHRCVQPIAYSVLTERISERFTELEAFDEILKNVTDFKPPNGIYDRGLYTLKPEYYDQIDPYFIHYTRRDRVEVEQVLENRNQKINLLRVPRLPQLNDSAFSGLLDLMESSLFYETITRSMQYAFRSTERSTNIVNEALYLLTMTVTSSVKANQKLAEFSTRPIRNSSQKHGGYEEVSLIELLLQYSNTKYSDIHHKVKFILQKLELSKNESVAHAIMEYEANIDEDDENTSESNRRKNTARNAQVRIANQFAEAQLQFLEQNRGTYDHTLMDMGDHLRPKRQRLWEDLAGPCIVCKEELERNSQYGMVGFLQLSNSVRYAPKDDEKMIRELICYTDLLDKPPSNTERFRDNLFRSSRDGIHASSCGHLMHQICFEKYISCQPTEHPRTSRKELLCPLCKTLGNVLIPIPEHKEGKFDDSTPNVEFEAWIENSFVSKLTESLVSSTDILANKPAKTENLENQYHLYSSMINTINNIRSESAGERIQNLNEREIFVEMLASTITNIEISHRETSSKSSGSLNETFLHRIDRSTWTMLHILSDNLNKAKVPEEPYLTQKLGATVDALLAYKWNENDQDKWNTSSPALYEDPFTLLVGLHEFAISYKLDLFYLVRVIYLLQLVQVIISTWETVILRDGNSFPDYSKVEGSSSEMEIQSEQEFIKQVLSTSGKSEAQIVSFFSIVKQPALKASIRKNCLPLLRKMLILLQSFFGFIPPHSQTEDADEEFERLCRYLRIPEMPESCQMNDLVLGWCKHIAFQCRNSRSKILLQFPGVYKLVELPNDVDTLVRESVVTACPNCHKISENPALCLLCGEIFCYQSSYCLVDQTGGCYRHMKQCSKTVGIFMVINQSVILLLRGTSGCILDAPYLDVHGEVDLGLT